jgi:hypothetical protein
MPVKEPPGGPHSRKACIPIACLHLQPTGTRGETRYYFFWHERLQAGGTGVSLEFQLPSVGSRAGWKVDQHGPFSQLRSVERPGHPAIHNHVRSG